MDADVVDVFEDEVEAAAAADTVTVTVSAGEVTVTVSAGEVAAAVQSDESAAATVAAAVAVAFAFVLLAEALVAALALPESLEELADTPGSCVMSTSWLPPAIGPLGLAGQEPAGETGALRPKGMVPVPPTAMPPTNVVKSAPWNWHWKRPLSSAFCGACWQ